MSRCFGISNQGRIYTSRWNICSDQVLIMQTTCGVYIRPWLFLKNICGHGDDHWRTYIYVLGIQRVEWLETKGVSIIAFEIKWKIHKSVWFSWKISKKWLGKFILVEKYLMKIVISVELNKIFRSKIFLA